MIRTGYIGPARYAEPSEAQAEVLQALDHDGPTHVLTVVERTGLTVGAVRNRLNALDRKHYVVGAPGDIWRNTFVLTGAGAAWRARLDQEVAA